MFSVGGARGEAFVKLAKNGTKRSNKKPVWTLKSNKRHTERITDA